MRKILAFLRHNSGIVIGISLGFFIVLYAYGCQSVVVSMIDPSKKVTRQQLVSEVDYFLSQAEARFADLDRQDLVKNTIFNSVLDLAAGGDVNPLGILTVLGNVVGLGAVIDNVRKRTHIQTLKGGNVHVEEKVKSQVKVEAGSG